MKTQVAIIGSGPAGLLLSEILYHHGIDSVVLEKQSREHVLQRIRAGVLEQETVAVLQTYGLGRRIHQESEKRQGFNLIWGDDRMYIDLYRYTKKMLTIYGQAEIQKDLFHAADQRNAALFTEVDAVKLMAVDTLHPYILFNHHGDELRLDCDYIAGCDGYHGVSRQAIPNLNLYEKEYPFGWLGVLSYSPPLLELTYVKHQRGFALASARTPELSRYYIQVPKKYKHRRLE